MILDKINIVVIKSQKSDKINECLKAIKSNTSIDYDLDIIKEKEFREKTLNYILKKFKIKNLVIIADDILVTNNWDISLLKFWKNNTIVGFSMKSPITKKNINYGYKIINLDGKLTTLPIKKRPKKKFITTDTFTGCFQAIPANVMQKISYFPLEGTNRWGEMLFHILAKKKKIKIITLKHELYHYGCSTKKNKEIKLSTVSYAFEEKIFKKINKKYLSINNFKSYKVKLDKKIKILFQKADFLFGAGYNCEYLLNNLEIKKNIKILSGLKEEHGLVFMKKKITYFDYLKSTQYSDKKIIITTENLPKKIINKLKIIFKSKNIKLLKSKFINNNKIIYI